VSRKPTIRSFSTVKIINHHKSI